MIARLAAAEGAHDQDGVCGEGAARGSPGLPASASMRSMRPSTVGLRKLRWRCSGIGPSMGPNGSNR